MMTMMTRTTTTVMMMITTTMMMMTTTTMMMTTMLMITQSIIYLTIMCNRSVFSCHSSRVSRRLRRLCQPRLWRHFKRRTRLPVLLPRLVLLDGSRRRRVDAAFRNALSFHGLLCLSGKVTWSNNCSNRIPLGAEPSASLEINVPLWP